MASQSADRLAELTFGVASDTEVGRLARHLATDPPLALWTICAAQQRDGVAPTTLVGVAQWLAAHALEALNANHAAEIRVPALDWGTLIDAGVVVAEIFQSLEQTDDCTASNGYLLALLHNAVEWLQRSATRAASDLTGALPAWLVDWSNAPAGAQLLRATQLAQTSNEGAPPEINVTVCRRRAEQVRDAWLAPGAWPDERISVLAAKLTRLAELEQHFADCLQREKLVSMAELAAGAGHEINNPLAVIAGRAQLFLQEEKDPERRRGLALINAQAMRVYEMIADLRLFARPPEPERRSFDLPQLVDRVLEELAPRAAEQETLLQRTGQPGPLAVNADPAQWAVALKALVTNALEALGGGGQVEIELSRQQAATCVRVSDDGPGIAPADLPHIFDPFFSARQAGRGLGMGLAKCWRIVTNHGGHIAAESRPGHGATFTIHLPD